MLKGYGEIPEIKRPDLNTGLLVSGIWTHCLCKDGYRTVKRECHDKSVSFMLHSIFSRNQRPDKNLFMKERLEGLLTSLEFTGLSGSWLLTQWVQAILNRPTSCNVATVTPCMSFVVQMHLRKHPTGLSDLKVQCHVDYSCKNWIKGVIDS